MKQFNSVSNSNCSANFQTHSSSMFRFACFCRNKSNENTHTNESKKYSGDRMRVRVKSCRMFIFVFFALCIFSLLRFNGFFVCAFSLLLPHQLTLPSIPPTLSLSFCSISPTFFSHRAFSRCHQIFMSTPNKKHRGHRIIFHSLS